MKPRNTQSTRNANLCFLFVCFVCFVVSPLSTAPAAETVRAMRFQAQTPAEARAWQAAARTKLFALLMGGGPPERVPLEAKVLRTVETPTNHCVLQELTLQALPDRRAHAWLARPTQPKGKVGAVLALHGHGGKGEEVVQGTGLYWYGRAMIERGYVVIAPDIGQHQLQHTNWTLMGERIWDALRCLDYVATLPEVDSSRLAVAGLSLGGETTMYVAAMDERLKAACSSGWLTTVTNMKNGHCVCYNFPGLEENFEFSDIFSCVAPRVLICELGEKERAPGGFPVPIGRQAFEQLSAAYRVFNAETNLTLTVHPGPHVFYGQDFWPKLSAALGGAAPKPAGAPPNSSK
jgi:acetyl esterase/lipase